MSTPNQNHHTMEKWRLTAKVPATLTLRADSTGQLGESDYGLLRMGTRLAPSIAQAPDPDAVTPCYLNKNKN